MMRFSTISMILRDRSPALRSRDLLLVIVLAGGLYGGVMGSFCGTSPLRGWQIVFSAIKVPMLLGISFGLTVPSFFIFNTLLGLRDDFAAAIRAAVTAQAGLAIVLAALSPFVMVWYASCAVYPWAILFNGAMFAIATGAGQILLRRFYRGLIARNQRHRTALLSWTVVYAFVAIQMAWVLRPFVGGPSDATTFFRHGAWGNAYVVIGEMIWNQVIRF